MTATRGMSDMTLRALSYIYMNARGGLSYTPLKTLKYLKLANEAYQIRI